MPPPPYTGRPSACQQLPGKLFHLQKAHCAQHKPHCRWDPCRKRQSLSALDSRQQQAPHTGRQHDARCHAAQDALRAGPRLPPQQKHACCPQCSARRRKQQYPRSENDLVHDTFPLCPVYDGKRENVQRTRSLSLCKPDDLNGFTPVRCRSLHPSGQHRHQLLIIAIATFIFSLAG